MKITVYSSKGSAGKTPISFNIARDRDYYVGTNEIEHVYDLVFPDEQVMAVEPETEFPELPAEVDIVFDLAGSLSRGNSPSIISAVKQSDLVIVPIWNEIKSIRGGIFSIREILAHNQNILVVATKLQKGRNEAFGDDWTLSEDFVNVRDTINTALDIAIPVLPLKYSTVFDTIFGRNQSINQICSSGFGLDRYTYRSVNQQFDEIYKHINGMNHAG